MMVWIGYVALAVAVIWIMAKFYVAFKSSGGTVMAVVYDAAVYPPIIGVVGLYLVLSANKINLASWVYAIIWAVTTGAAVGGIRLMEEIGDRQL